MESPAKVARRRAQVPKIGEPTPAKKSSFLQLAPAAYGRRVGPRRLTTHNQLLTLARPPPPDSWPGRQTQLRSFLYRNTMTIRLLARTLTDLLPAVALPAPGLLLTKSEKPPLPDAEVPPLLPTQTMAPLPIANGAWLATPAQAVAAAEEIAPRLAAQAAQTDVVGAFPTQEFSWLRETGLLTAALPLALGGAGLHAPTATAALLQLLRHIGRGNLAVGRLLEGHLNAQLLLQLFAQPAQCVRYAADARAGHLFGVWNTEDPAQGVHLEPLPGGRYRLRGAKTFASGAGHISRPLITGALPDQQGWQLFVLPADVLPPVLDHSFWRPLGMRATASFRADLTGLEVGPEDLIGQPGDYYRQPWFSGGAIRFAAVQLGGAEAVFNETRRFLRGLGRTDDPYQRQRLGEMALLLESGSQWLRAAAEHAARPAALDQTEPTIAYANLVRTAIEDVCLRTLQLAERSVGARGLLEPLPFERLHRDLTHYLRQPAPDGAQADAGRYVLSLDQPAHLLWNA